MATNPSPGLTHGPFQNAPLFFESGGEGTKMEFYNIQILLKFSKTPPSIDG
jgi:hypothetical protein